MKNELLIALLITRTYHEHAEELFEIAVGRFASMMVQSKNTCVARIQIRVL